jgi:prolipoprotein diacylglyceryltransferase
MMASAFIGLLGVILGALLTYVLTTNARKDPQQSLRGPSAQTDEQKLLEPKERSQTKKGE